MTTIRLFTHPLDAQRGMKLYEADSIGEWLLAHYGPTMPRGLRIFGGLASAATEITGNVEAITRNDAPYYTVLESPPGDPTGGLASILINLAISTVISVIARSLFAPDKPTLGNRAQESPNNSLGNRDNRVRILERVEDIYGTVRSIPSLMMPTYAKYVSHRKVEFGLYCVGRGYYLVEDVREADTPLGDISGASAEVYHPFTSPNSGVPVAQIGDDIIDPVLSVESVVAIENITLKPTNQLQMPASYTYTFLPPGAGSVPPHPNNDMVFQNDTHRKPNFNSIMAVGDQVDINYADFNGRRTITEVGNGYILLDAPSRFPTEKDNQVASVLLVNPPSDWTDWYTLKAQDRTEVWINVVARAGIIRTDPNGNDTALTVDYEAQVERLDAVTLAPTGQVETFAGQLNGATRIERAETLERVTAWVGPARVRVRRTTPFPFTLDGSVVDEITLTDVYSVSPVTRAHFGNKTLIHTVVRATPAATTVANRQLNCLASRLLPTYDPATDTFSGAFSAEGGLLNGNISQTSRIVDIIPAIVTDPRIGALAITDLDMPQVQSVQDALDAWHPEVGQFNHTFDTDQLSFEETLVAVADAAFCRPIRQNGVIRLSADLPQDAPEDVVALYTHRNKDPSFEETVTRTFSNDADYDGVELVYADPDSEAQETIRLPLDGSASKYKRIEVSGIRSFAQAWFRANREMNRLTYERVSIITQVTTDARALLPNSKVDIVDNTLLDTADGEVVGQDGLELTLSTDVEFVAGESHSLVVTLRDGTTDSIPVTPGSAPNRVLLARLPIEPLVTDPDPDEGVRTIFSFAADTARGAEHWLVRELELTDNNFVKLTCGQYVPEYYAADSQPVPVRDSVLNAVWPLPAPPAPPAAQRDASYPNVSLLLHFDAPDNTTVFTDNSPRPKVATPVGNARILHEQSVFGGSALYVDGTGDYVQFPDHADFSFGAGDFTIELRARFTAYPVNNAGNYLAGLVVKDNAVDGREFGLYAVGTATPAFTQLEFLGFHSAGAAIIAVNHAFVLDTWYAIAAVRRANLLYLFVDGVLKNPGGTAIAVTLNDTAAPVRVGAADYNATYQYYTAGFIDEVRVTKGVGRYVADYAVAAQPFPNNGP